MIGYDLLLVDGNGWATRLPEVVLHGRMVILTVEGKVYQYDMITPKMEKIASDIHDIRHHDQKFIDKIGFLHLTNNVESLARICQGTLTSNIVVY